MNNRETLRVVLMITWRILVMTLCAAAIACTGWYVAWERVFESAFELPLGGVIGCMCVSGFISWLYIGADVFVTMQDEVRIIIRGAQMIRARTAQRKRLEMLCASNPTPSNVRKTLRSIERVKG